METSIGRPLNLLSVEDNYADVAILRELFEASAPDTRIHFLTDGDQVLEYLRAEATLSASRLPDLILLDLNLPRKDGREVLKELKNDPKFRVIPVLVLTASSRSEDITECYANSACSVITKPTDFAEFDRVVRGIQSYWLGVARLPGTVDPLRP